MHSIPFCKLLPGGNSTIILMDSDLPPDELPAVSAALMHPLHMQAEQVGALLTSTSTPHLQMMGGEFCVNATRSAALLLARTGMLLKQDQCFHGEVTVSGMVPPVRIAVSEDESALTRGMEVTKEEGFFCGSKERAPSRAASKLPTQLYCAARIACGAGSTKLLEISPGVCLVHLPGISHLLIDVEEHPMPADWAQATGGWRVRAGLGMAPASGVVWYKRTGSSYEIWPAVEVRATASEHMETACGSASTAIALMHHAANEQPSEESILLPVSLPRSSIPGENSGPLRIMQPSGEVLSVLLQGDNSETKGSQGSRIPEYAWVFGRVSLLAEGIAHV